MGTVDEQRKKGGSKRMSFVNDMRNTVRNYHAAVVSAEKEMAEFTLEYSGVYRGEVFKQKRAALAEKRDAAVKNGNDAIYSLLHNFKEKIKGIDALVGADLTDDAKLLDSPIELSKEDLTAIYDRNKGNRTMQQLTMQRAKKAGIFIDRIFYTEADIVIDAEKFTKSALTAMPGMNNDFFNILWADDKKFEKLVPESIKGL